MRELLAKFLPSPALRASSPLGRGGKIGVSSRRELAPA